MTESDAFKELLDALCRIETAILGLSSNVNRVGDDINKLNLVLGNDTRGISFEINQLRDSIEIRNCKHKEKS